MIETSLAELSAIIGSLLFLCAYAYINRKTGATNDLAYILMNLVAASFMLYSLVEFWNIGVLINNLSWMVISTYSAIKHLRNKRTELQPLPL